MFSLDEKAKPVDGPDNGLCAALNVTICDLDGGNAAVCSLMATGVDGAVGALLVKVFRYSSFFASSPSTCRELGRKCS